VSVDGIKITVITGNALKSNALATSRKNTNIAKAMGDSKAFQFATKVWTVMQVAAAPVQNTTVTYMFSRNLCLATFVSEINFSPEKKRVHIEIEHDYFSLIFTVYNSI